MAARFSDITAIPAQEFSKETPQSEVEMSFGRDVLEEWIRVARWLLPDAEVRSILIYAADRLGSEK